jgi:dTDP-4-amino-4,6-dideoxygalactose transaminase
MKELMQRHPEQSNGGSVEAVPFFVPWITEEDKKSVLDALNSPWLTNGPRVREFERLFAEYVGVEHAIACNSCTAALHMVMKALGIKDGDEVIVPVLTFAATANAVLFVGARPVLADVDERTLNISPNDISNKITRNTKAILPVHYAGQPCDMKEIREIAEDHDISVVEDCAHSLGATYKGKKTGSIGMAGCFSFYPTKNITALEGGMITTDNGEVDRKARLLREHCMTRSAMERETARTWFYDVVGLGYNYRLNEVQAALATSQLRRIDEINMRRAHVAHNYDRQLAKTKGIRIPHVGQNRTHAHHLHVIRVIENEYGASRDELFEYLSARRIGLSVHFTPLHLLSYYKERLGYESGAFPIAEAAYKEILSLPLFPELTRDQASYVIESVREGSSRAGHT